MGWVKIDDQFYDHPKVELVGNAGAGLYVKSLAYSARHLTDGTIPGAWVQKEAASDDGLAQRLVNAGLWQPLDETEGYRIPDYLEFNPSREDVLSRRDMEREKKRKQRMSPGDRAGTPGTGTGTKTGKKNAGEKKRVVARVAGKPVTDDERLQADAILAAFNKVAESAYTLTAHLTPLVGRIREHPEVSVEAHRRIIEANFANPWWSDRPGVEVLYGNARAFERAMERAKGGIKPLGEKPDYSAYDRTSVRDEAAVA